MRLSSNKQSTKQQTKEGRSKSMCRTKLKKLGGLTSLGAAAFLGLLATLPTQTANAACATGGNLGAGVVVTPAVVHLNDFVNITQYSVNIGANSCNASYGMTWIVYPDNHNELGMQNFTLL